MKKILVNTILGASDFFYSGRKYNVSSNGAMANLGCGMRCLPGWSNVDGSLTALFGSKKYSFINKLLYGLAGSSAYYSFSEYDRVIKQSGLLFFDLRNGAPFKDGSLDVIFTSHFLEHLRKEDGRRFLKDCYRALKNGGIMRIAVPDLDIAFGMYKDGKVEEMQDLFFYNSDGKDFHSHKYNYNFESLSGILEAAGFKKIEKKEYQKGDCPNIDFLDVYPEESLYVECRK